MDNGRRYERFCAHALLHLDRWCTAAETGAPDFRRYSIAAAKYHPLVYRRTKAGDRAVELIRALLPPEGDDE